jgi:hypothetical protein
VSHKLLQELPVAQDVVHQAVELHLSVEHGGVMSLHSLESTGRSFNKNEQAK